MISKITYSVFLFLLLFTLISTNIRIEVWHIRNRGTPRIISYRHKAKVNHEDGYIFRVEIDSRADIIYWIGAQSNAYIKIQTAEIVGAIKQEFYENSTEFDVYITRATSKAGINTFQELLHNVIVKTPKLYRVKGALAIRQVQLSCDVINKDDSFVLDNGLWVAVYHSPTSEMKRKIADSLAAYIVQAEHDEDQKSSSDYDGNSENTLETFCNKILNALQGISQNSEGNSTVVKKLSKKDIIAITAEAALFENKKKKVFELLKKNMVLTETHFPHNSRILSTPTTSSSTVPTHTHKGKNSKAAKRETISKATKNIPFLESVFGRESKNVAAISTSTDPGNMKYEKLIPIFMGSEECAPRIQPPLIDTLKSMCLYMLKDLENNELLIYVGKNSPTELLKTALIAAEIDISENPLVKATTILEGNIIPTNFMIHIESEIKNFLLE